LWNAIEARRAWGVLRRLPDELDAAAATYERIGAAPVWARAAREEAAGVRDGRIAPAARPPATS
jgi:hypothetical protein